MFRLIPLNLPTISVWNYGSLRFFLSVIKPKATFSELLYRYHTIIFWSSHEVSSYNYFDIYIQPTNYQYGSLRFFLSPIKPQATFPELLSMYLCFQLTHKVSSYFPELLQRSFIKFFWSSHDVSSYNTFNLSYVVGTFKFFWCLKLSQATDLI